MKIYTIYKTVIKKRLYLQNHLQQSVYTPLQNTAHLTHNDNAFEKTGYANTQKSSSIYKIK